MSATREETARDAGAALLLADVSKWLIDEAMMLDRDRYRDWLALLAPDLRYTMPVRENRVRADGDGTTNDFMHFDENHLSMETRIARLDSRSAWAEDPPSRSRRFVTNVRVQEIDDELVSAESYLLLMRSRSNDPAFEVLSCERQDTLRRDAASYQLVTRRVIVDQATLGMINLALFL